ncbi:unnamed protein product, partial [Didymodactylos carnosus]
GDDIRLKHVLMIAEYIDILPSLPNYLQYIDLLIKNFLRTLRETEPVFIAQLPAQLIRKHMIDILHRLPTNDYLRPHIKDILTVMLKLIQTDNEENALLYLRIIVELKKQFRPQLITEVREFLQFIHAVYRRKSMLLDKLFYTKSYTFSNTSLSDISASLDTILDEIFTTITITVRKPTVSVAPTATDEQTETVYTIIPRASYSLKILAEYPIVIVLLFQLCRQALQTEFGDLIPLFLQYLILQPTNEQRAQPNFSIDIYIDFLTTQVKTLSFLAFVGKQYQEQLAQYSETLVLALIQLLENCPPENVQLRKDIIVAARHILSTDLRNLFIPHVKRFFDENLLLSTGYTAHETLKALAYNTIADFFHHIRQSLTFDDLVQVIRIYSKIIHDTTLPASVQIMCLKFLGNVAETIRQKADKENQAHDLLIRIVEILVFKFKVVAKQCSQLYNEKISAKSTLTDTIVKEEVKPLIQQNDLDLDTCTLADVLQSMNDSQTNKEREQQHSRVQSLSMSITDYRQLIKCLVSSLRNITWILVEVKIVQDSVLSQPRQFSQTVTLLYIKFFKYSLQCIDIFSSQMNTVLQTEITSNSLQTLSTPSTIVNRQVVPLSLSIPSSSATRSKDEKEIMDLIANVFHFIHRSNCREIFERILPYLYERSIENSNITLIPNSLLQHGTSTILVQVLIDFLLPRMSEIGGRASNERSNVCLKLFKLLINSVSTIPNDNETIIQPHLQTIIRKSIEYAQKSQDPVNYFMLLRALFRSIGVGNHELLNQEFLPLLPDLLQRLNEYQSCKHRQNLRELFIELCLTVPVRLSVLLPYLPLLMEPLVSALNGSQTLILQGLRTLELCVDNLQPDFLYSHIHPVRSDLMISLYRILHNTNTNHLQQQDQYNTSNNNNNNNINNVSQNAYRILGKLGGNNRRILNESQRLELDKEENDYNTNKNVHVHLLFENEQKPITVPILKILQLCSETLKSSTNDLFVKRNAWLIVKNILCVIITIDNDHELVQYFLSHQTFLNGKICQQSSTWNKINSIIQPYRYYHDLLFKCLYQAAAINKDLENDTLSMIKATIRHYTLVSLTQQTGPFVSDIYGENRLNGMDCSLILIDSIISAYIHEDNEINDIGRLSLEIFVDTLLTILNGDYIRLLSLPIWDYFIQRICHQSHDPIWFSKNGACRIINELTTNYFKNSNEFLLRYIVQFIRSLFFIILSLTNEITAGTIDLATDEVQRLLKQCFVDVNNNEQKIIREVISELISHITSPISSIRELSFDCLKKLSEYLSQPLSILFEPFKIIFHQNIFSLKHLPLKYQSINFQLALMESYTFIRTLEPKFNLLYSSLTRSDLTTFDDELFKDLSYLCLTNEDDLIKQQPCYRHSDAQQLLTIKKQAVRTICVYHEANEHREKVLRLIYKMVTLSTGELQESAFECFQQILANHADALKLRFVENYLQQITPLSQQQQTLDGKCLTLNIAQVCAYLAKLAPQAFDEKLCDVLLNNVRKLLETIVNTYRTITNIANNTELKTCIIILELFSSLPTCSQHLIEQLTILILRTEKHLMIEASSPFRPPFLHLLSRQPHLSLQQFFFDDIHMKDPQWCRLCIQLVKSSSTTNHNTNDDDLIRVRSYIRLNLIDRFRFLLTEHVSTIETSSSDQLSYIICFLIRLLNQLAKNDLQWWSQQHDFILILLRLWRTKLFQYHSLFLTDHYDSMCYKEQTWVLNLLMYYYKQYPDKIHILIELIRIYATNGGNFERIPTPVYPNKFSDYLQQIVIKTYSIQWKRDAFSKFLVLCQDLTYPIDCKAAFLEYVLIPAFAYEFENGQREQLLAPMKCELSDVEETPVELFIRTTMDSSILRHSNDKFRISLLRFSCLLLEFAHEYICDVNNKRQDEKLRRLMECAYSTLVMNNLDPTFKCQAHLLLCHIIAKFAINKKIVL